MKEQPNLPRVHIVHLICRRYLNYISKGMPSKSFRVDVRQRLAGENVNGIVAFHYASAFDFPRGSLSVL